MERRRSPPYPFINLAKAKVLAAKLPRNRPIRAHDAAKAWGREETSSRAAQAIGALRQFGLVETEGRRENRWLRLTPLGHRIAEADDPQARQEAALHPEIFGELWRELQSGKTNRTELLQSLTMNRAYPFNPTAASDVLRIFAESIMFAQLPVGPNDLGELMVRPAAVTEEVLAMGKVRIIYREQLERSDFAELRDHFEAKLRRYG
jgi:hypothetical protein